MIKQILLDTETTGIDFQSGHRIIEIGCVEMVNRKLTGSEFHTYLNPDREVDEGAIKIHGLTLEFLQDKPRFKDVVDEFLEFIKDSELLIHNAEFDIGFLNYELSLMSGRNFSIQDITEKITDTLQLAREQHPGQRNSLDALVQRYKVTGHERELHGALLDSKILGDVYLAMTGGQTDLLFDSNVQQHLKERVNSSPKRTHNGNSQKPMLIKLSKEEEQDNLDYLNKMKKETGVEPIWLEE